MKKILIISMCTALWGSLFSQLTIDSQMDDNKLTSHLGTGDILDPGLEDLFFAISPNGIPQYGRTVSWNLWPETNDEVRYYRVDKDDLGREAISDSIIHVESSPKMVYDPKETPNLDMDRNWVKLSRSWNFSRGAYNIVVVSVENQGEEILKKGKLKFGYPSLDMSVSEVKIYNEWAVVSQIDSSPDEEVYSLTVKDLLPGEVIHIYFYLDVLERNTRAIDADPLFASLDGKQGVTMTVNKTNPPHDPNGLTLINAYVNTPPINDCEPFLGHPVLEEVCASGVPFWYDSQGIDVGTFCKSFTDTYCDLDYSLYYPYCNVDQERLTYQITCLNDGLGIAGKVIMKTSFEGEDLFIDNSFTTDESSHHVQTTWENPEADFLFDNINLPGLNDPEVVYMYNECSAQVTFSIDTQCGINEEIIADGIIEFYDTNGDLADDPLATNTVKAVPLQGQFDNIEPTCISCIEARRNPNQVNTSEKYILSTGEGNNYITITKMESDAIDLVDGKTSLHIVDVSGRVIKQLSIPSYQMLSPGHRIDVSDLSTGIYFLSGVDGENRFAKKFIH